MRAMCGLSAFRYGGSISRLTIQALADLPDSSRTELLEQLAVALNRNRP